MINDTKIFKVNNFKNLIFLLLSSAFVVIGILILQDEFLKGLLIILLFGLGVIIFLLQLHPASSHLKLTQDGFEVKMLFRSSFTKWTHVKDFEKGVMNGNKMIFFDYTSKHKKWKNGKKTAKFLSGKEGAMQSIYKISTDELVKLMIEYKLKSEKESLKDHK